MGKETQLEREPQQEKRQETRDEAWVRCAACGHALAPEKARIDVDGRHVHTFVNPGGHEYTIRCFGEAPGCAGAGEESTFWSWFRGFAWRIAVCARCGTQVGWSFRRETGVFWGLIVERVVG
jgi:hypothetical protein